MDFERIKLAEIGKGCAFDSKPHFIAESKTRFPETPGFYLYDETTGKVFTSYLRELNEEKDSPSLDKTYNVVVRGVGGKLHDGTTLAFLEERVRQGDLVHVQATEGKRGDATKLVGRFMKYIVFINSNDGQVDLGDYVFGKVGRITDSRRMDQRHKLFDLVPQSIVSESRYDKYRNVIIRSD